MGRKGEGEKGKKTDSAGTVDRCTGRERRTGHRVSICRTNAQYVRRQSDIWVHTGELYDRNGKAGSS